MGQSILSPLISNVLQRNTFLNHIVVLELASGASESCYLTVQEFRVIVLNISFDFNEDGLLVKLVFCNNVNFILSFSVPPTAYAGVFFAFDEDAFEVAFKHQSGESLVVAIDDGLYSVVVLDLKHIVVLVYESEPECEEVVFNRIADIFV